MTVDLLRTGRRAPVSPSVRHLIVGARAFLNVLLPLLMPIAALGLVGWLVIVAPFSTIEAALALAIPCLLVRLRRAEF
jgi:hypothetical protein